MTRRAARFFARPSASPRRSPRSRLISLLGVLYVAQGLPFGVQATALPVLLRERGVSLVAIGLSGALAAPWILKILWAPLVDRFGRRRSWIVPLTAASALVAFAAAPIAASGELWPLLGVVFVMNLLAATQDIAVDGLAVDLLAGDERGLGLGNAAQVVGYKVGMLVGGGLLVWASARIGPEGLFTAIGVLTLGALVAALALREPQSAARTERETIWAVLRTLLETVRRPAAPALLAIVGTYKLGESLVDAMWKPFLVDAGWTASRIGLWVGTIGMGASLAGSLAGGWLAARGSLVRALWIAALLRVVPLAAQTLIAAGGVTGEHAIAAVTVAEHCFGGALTTVMFALMMSRVDRQIGATHFTALATVEVMGKSPAAWGSGFLAHHLGYAGVFLVGTLLSIAFLGLVRLVPTSPPSAESGAVTD